MKIGILTLQFLTNYGGILQNWALQQVLIKMGHEPLTFEHDTCYSRSRWLLQTLKQIVLTRSFGPLLAYPYRGRVGHKPFIDFIVKNIRSVTVHNFTPELEHCYNCKAFIVGSDQVWRPAFTWGRLYNMFLNFVSDSVRKIAYAASFGVSEWEYTIEETNQCRTLAKRFDAISVREDTAVTLCRNYLDVTPQCVLDPTLLLDKEDYLTLCQEVKVSKNMVFVYALHIDDCMVRFANALAKEKSLTVKILLAGDSLRPEDSIEQWVAMFRDADYVVTDSFHGMAFSIVFNKPFFIFKNEGGGVARYYSLLQMMGLEHRIVDGQETRESQDIDWMTVNKILDEKRKKSLSFLRDSLS